jgi:hypothetical protein
MERTNEKSIELTTAELDVVTGGMAPTIPTHVPPRNPFPWPPTDPKPSY